MTRERVIDFLTRHGECLGANVDIPGMRPKTTLGLLARMTASGVLTRRAVEYKDRVLWAYSVKGDGPKEPEHIYILRNLPRFPLSAEACQ